MGTSGAVTPVMRVVLGILLVGAMAVTVGGCSDEDSGSSLTGRRNTKDGTSSGSSPTGTNPTGTDPTTQVSAAVTACQAVAAPTQLSEAKDATDIHIAGTGIFFQSGASVNRVLKDGTNKKTVFTSPNLTNSWADAKGLLLVETSGPDNPNATLRAFNANPTEPGDQNPNPSGAFPQFPVGEGDQGPGGATAGTNFNAASAKIFGADDDNYYLQADDGNGNALIVAVNRNDPNNRANLVTTDKVITNPQIASSAIWWVQEGNRVFKQALATGDQGQGAPTEVFGVGSSCSLAVNEQNAFCSLGATIEQRDLTGAGAKTLMDANASKTSGVAYGVPQYFDSHLFVRNLSAAADVKNMIRAIATGGAADEKLVACGRVGNITGVAVDKDNVVWTEDQTGVFMTTR
jgi:hypothetical protein